MSKPARNGTTLKEREVITEENKSEEEGSSDELDVKSLNLLNNYHEKLQQKNKELEEANKKNKSHSQTIEKLQKTIGNLQSDLDSMGSENFFYHEQITKLQNEIITIKGKQSIEQREFMKTNQAYAALRKLHVAYVKHLQMFVQFIEKYTKEIEKSINREFVSGIVLQERLPREMTDLLVFPPNDSDEIDYMWEMARARVGQAHYWWVHLARGSNESIEKDKMVGQLKKENRKMAKELKVKDAELSEMEAMVVKYFDKIKKLEKNGGKTANEKNSPSVLVDGTPGRSVDALTPSTSMIINAGTLSAPDNQMSAQGAADSERSPLSVEPKAKEAPSEARNEGGEADSKETKCKTEGEDEKEGETVNFGQMDEAKMEEEEIFMEEFNEGEEVGEGEADQNQRNLEEKEKRLGLDLAEEEKQENRRSTSQEPKSVPDIKIVVEPPHDREESKDAPDSFRDVRQGMENLLQKIQAKNDKSTRITPAGTPVNSKEVQDVFFNSLVDCSCQTEPFEAQETLVEAIIQGVGEFSAKIEDFLHTIHHSVLWLIPDLASVKKEEQSFTFLPQYFTKKESLSGTNPKIKEALRNTSQKMGETENLAEEVVKMINRIYSENFEHQGPLVMTPVFKQAHELLHGKEATGPWFGGEKGRKSQEVKEETKKQRESEKSKEGKEEETEENEKKLPAEQNEAKELPREAETRSDEAQKSKEHSYSGGATPEAQQESGKSQREESMSNEVDYEVPQIDSLDEFFSTVLACKNKEIDGALNNEEEKNAEENQMDTGAVEEMDEEEEKSSKNQESGKKREEMPETTQEENLQELFSDFERILDKFESKVSCFEFYRLLRQGVGSLLLDYYHCFKDIAAVLEVQNKEKNQVLSEKEEEESRRYSIASEPSPNGYKIKKNKRDKQLPEPIFSSMDFVPGELRKSKNDFKAVLAENHFLHRLIVESQSKIGEIADDLQLTVSEMAELREQNALLEKHRMKSHQIDQLVMDLAQTKSENAEYIETIQKLTEELQKNYARLNKQMDYIEKCQEKMDTDESVILMDSSESKLKELEEKLREKETQIKNLIGINRSKGNVIDELKRQFYEMGDSSSESIDFHNVERGKLSVRSSEENEKNCAVF